LVSFDAVYVFNDVLPLLAVNAFICPIEELYDAVKVCKVVNLISIEAV
jgi:hypothetical protein